MPDLPNALIDVHCHVFNGSDLPALTFINNVVRERHGAEGDAILLLIGAFRDTIIGSAPRAANELAALRGDPPPQDDADAGAGLSGLAIPGLGGHTSDHGSGAHAQPPAGVDGGLIDWLRLFGHSRQDLIAKLAGLYSATGKQCVLMTPALVDYDAWLREPERKHRRLTDQVAVMGEIARRPGPVRVHGFVGFDPVRAILADVGRNPNGIVTLPPIKPLDLVREAVTRHGFLGVKLYPPMGFRATRNGDADMTFPQSVKHDVNSDGIGDRDLGRLIDRELDKLYRFCADEGVPILAHAYNSNQSGQCFGWRASPQYWGEVIDKFSTPQKPLRICLAHFGRFDAHTVNATCVDAGMAGKVWEIIFANIVHKTGGTHAYADMSYFSEVLDRKPGFQERRAKLAQKLKNYFADHDPEVERVCYGSDWILLGREPGHADYHEQLGAFMRDEVGLSGAQLGRFFLGNARRFLGLEPGDQSRTRLERFYRDNHIEDHFPKIDAMV